MEISISKAEQFVVALASIPFDANFNATIYKDTDILESVVAVNDRLIQELCRHSKIYDAIEELRLAITSVEWLRELEAERLTRVNTIATVNHIAKQVADKPAIKDLQGLRKLQEILPDGEGCTFFALLDEVVQGINEMAQTEIERLSALKAAIKARKDAEKVFVSPYVIAILVENKIVDNPAECG